MKRRQSVDPQPTPPADEAPPRSISVQELLADADAASERLRDLARRILPTAEQRRDGFAHVLLGHAEPEEHVRPEHLIVARLCRDCERFISTPNERLEWAKTQYAESHSKLLAFVSEEIDGLDAEVESGRVALGVHPERAEEVRAKLNLRDRYRRYRAQLLEGRGHEVPRLQLTHEGWAMTFYSANTEEWGKLAERAPVELIPDEQVVHDMPTFLREVADELAEAFDVLFERAVALGLAEHTPQTRKLERGLAQAQLVRRA